MGEHRTVTEHKNPIEQALDVFVFAPLGFILSARQTIPELAEKGRQYAAAAKMMGEFAIGQGRDQAEKAVRQAGDQASQTLSVVGNLSGRRPPTPAAPRPPQAPSPPTPPPTPPPASPPEGASAPAEAETIDHAGNGHVAPRPTAENLAIPGYDTLSASQVVQRLGGLSADELEAVRAYEESGRKRKTILTRVEQLQSGS
jgi:hypothetical protein